MAAATDLVIERASVALPADGAAADKMQPLPNASEQYSSLIEFDPDGDLPRPPRMQLRRRSDASGAGGFLYDGVRAGRAIRAGLSRRSAAARPLPMEEVTLFIKALDNSGVRRVPDPACKAAWARYVTVGVVSLLLMLFSYGPRAGLRHSGYRLADLEREYQQLAEFNEQLKVRHAQLSDLRRVGELAGNQGFVAPPPGRFAWQDRTIVPAPHSTEGVLAQNWALIP